MICERWQLKYLDRDYVEVGHFEEITGINYLFDPDQYVDSEM